MDFFSKMKKIPQILPNKKKEAAPRQVQHWLSRSPHNVGTNFRTQEEQKIVSNNLFKLSHTLHIYNEQGKKETIETLLMGSDSNT